MSPKKLSGYECRTRKINMQQLENYRESGFSDAIKSAKDLATLLQVNGQFNIEATTIDAQKICVSP